MLGKELNVGALPLDEHVHVAPGSLALFTDFVPQLGSLFVQLLPGRERRDGKPELLFGRERCDGPGNGRGEGRVQLVPRREGWQNLLHAREPAIEIFEMSRDHGVVHQPHLPENDGGDRTAILASSWRGNARAVTPKKIRHKKDTRVNIPTEELRDFVAEDEKAPKAILYPRGPSLDPQLVWKGKDEQDAAGGDEPYERKVINHYGGRGVEGVRRRGRARLIVGGPAWKRH